MIDSTLSGCSSEISSRQTSHDRDADEGGTPEETGDGTLGIDWGEIVAADELVTIQTDEARRPGAAIPVDSGATEVVAPPTCAADHVAMPAPGPTKGTQYRVASRNTVAHQGEKTIRMMAGVEVYATSRSRWLASPSPRHQQARSRAKGIGACSVTTTTTPTFSIRPRGIISSCTERATCSS